MAIILVEQYIEFALNLADDVIVLDRGRVRISGPASTLDASEIREAVTF
jgi:urea transport system ATP-binding protein